MFHKSTIERATDRKAGVLSKIEQKELSGNLTSGLMAISEVAEIQMGGTSGGLFSIFFNALAAEFSKLDEDIQLDTLVWSKALKVKCLNFALSTIV